MEVCMSSDMVSYVLLCCITYNCYYRTDQIMMKVGLVASKMRCFLVPSLAHKCLDDMEVGSCCYQCTAPL